MSESQCVVSAVVQGIACNMSMWCIICKFGRPKVAFYCFGLYLKWNQMLSNLYFYPLKNFPFLFVAHSSLVPKCLLPTYTSSLYIISLLAFHLMCLMQIFPTLWTISYVWGWDTRQKYLNFANTRSHRECICRRWRCKFRRRNGLTNVLMLLVWTPILNSSPKL